MTARSFITLGVFVLLGFAVVVVLRLPDTGVAASVAVAATPASSAPASSPRVTDAAAPSPRVPAKVADTPSRAAPIEVSAVGQANGKIHFQRQPKDEKSSKANIDLDVHSALGVWQPGENLMRILLLEAAPKGDDVAQILNAIQSGGVSSVARRVAVIELRFIPTAQAFDRNELDSARLIVSDGTLTSAADALNSLDWQGSLPSPQLELPPDRDNPTVALTSASESVTSERETWLQSWQLSLSVPVIMRK